MKLPLLSFAFFAQENLVYLIAKYNDVEFKTQSHCKFLQWK